MHTILPALQKPFSFHLLIKHYIYIKIHYQNCLCRYNMCFFQLVHSGHQKSTNLHSHSQSNWYNMGRFPPKTPLQQLFTTKKLKIRVQQIRKQCIQKQFPISESFIQLSSKAGHPFKNINALTLPNQTKKLKNSYKSLKKQKTIEGIIKLRNQKQAILGQTQSMKLAHRKQIGDLQMRVIKKKRASETTNYGTLNPNFDRRSSSRIAINKKFSSSKNCPTVTKIELKKQNLHNNSISIVKKYSSHLKVRAKTQPISMEIKNKREKNGIDDNLYGWETRLVNPRDLDEQSIINQYQK